MKVKDVMLFAYDFPHKKTQDFIYRLLVEDINIKYCIAAPKKKLNIPQSSIRISPKNEGIIHAEKICERFKIPYHISDHNSPISLQILKDNPVDLYIISGARILSKEVIFVCRNKILNVHPGLLPNMRGLDTLLWSIYKNTPIGISSHLIGKKIDSGVLIYKEKLKLMKDDSIIDVSLRLIEKQTDILMKSISLLKRKEINNFPNLDYTIANYYKKMPEVYEKKIRLLYSKWLKKYS